MGSHNIGSNMCDNVDPAELVGLICQLPMSRVEVPEGDLILSNPDYNRDGDKPFGGHPAIILGPDEEHPGRVLAVQCTSFNDQKLIEKYPGPDKAEYRSWWLLLQDERREAHDGLPIVRLRDGARMPKPTYASCLRVFSFGSSYLSVLKGETTGPRIYVEMDSILTIRDQHRALELSRLKIHSSM
jgi:hypothetical protein